MNRFRSLLLYKKDKIDISKPLKECIAISNGWEGVATSLVTIGFSFMESNQKVEQELNELNIRNKLLKKSNPVQVGIKLLKLLFLKHEYVQKNIIEEILMKILTSNNSPKNVEYYIKLFKILIREDPHRITDNFLPKIRELIDYLSLIKLNYSRKVLKAIVPLYSKNRGFRDNVILVLRKALFSVNIDSRKIAVSGFLSLLRASGTYCLLVRFLFFQIPVTLFTHSLPFPLLPIPPSYPIAVLIFLLLPLSPPFLLRFPPPFYSSFSLLFSFLLCSPSLFFSKSPPPISSNYFLVY